MMANFDINVFIIARENSCKIGRAPYGVRLIFYNAGRAMYDIVRCPAVHRPMFSYTDAGRRRYDMWPRKRKFLKIVRCPGDYQIRQLCAHRWNRTMSILYVTIALAVFIWSVSLITFTQRRGIYLAIINTTIEFSMYSILCVWLLRRYKSDWLDVYILSDLFDLALTYLHE